MVGTDVNESRRARTAIQILVAAADGEIRAGGGQIDRKGSGGMGEIPKRQRAGLVDNLGPSPLPARAAGPGPAAVLATAVARHLSWVLGDHFHDRRRNGDILLPALPRICW